MNINAWDQTRPLAATRRNIRFLLTKVLFEDQTPYLLLIGIYDWWKLDDLLQMIQKYK